MPRRFHATCLPFRLRNDYFSYFVFKAPKKNFHVTMIAWLLLVNSVSAVGACAADLKTGAHRHMRRGEPRPPPHSATSISIEDGSIPLGQVAHSGHHFLDVGVRKRVGNLSLDLWRQAGEPDCCFTGSICSILVFHRSPSPGQTERRKILSPFKI